MKQSWSSLDYFRSHAVSSSREERGVILPLTLMILLILAAMVGALLSLGVVEPQIAGNVLRGAQAHFAAEAGVEHVFTLMLAAQNPTDYSLNFNAFLTGGSPQGTALATTNLPVGVGAYSVRIIDNDDGDGNTLADTDNTVIALSTGTAPGGATRTVRAVVTNRFQYKDAVVTNGPLTVTGSACVTGDSGSVHSNDDLSVQGNAVVIEENVTATDTVTVQGNPTIADKAASGEKRHPIPDLAPNTFRPLADYILKADGTITNQAGTVLTASTIPPRPPEWNYGGGKWSCCGGANGTPGTVFAETAVDMSGSPNCPVPNLPSCPGPWRLTLITTGDLGITGNPSFAPAIDPTTGKPRDIQFLSGRDIRMGGSPAACTVCLAGLIYAREQFELTGNQPIRGVVMAFDLPHTPGSPVNANKLSGSVCVIHNTGLRTRNVFGPLQILSQSAFSQ